MTHFLEAYNKGDQDRLSRFFVAKWEQTPWLYAMSRGRKVEVGVDNRKDLLRYFAHRHEQHDRMLLLSIQVIPNSGISGGQPRGGIAYSLARRADDLEQGSVGTERLVEGKGAIDCRRQKFTLLTLTTLPVKPKYTRASTLQCPKPDGRNQDNAIVACTGSSR
ncbi:MULTISPECIES: hypothetical protein [Rubrobacter]|uniref:hypothetical protein n=1 Tax=Rubrobacter TaxID=42255 RepID=UPI0023618A33|nr:MULTISPECIES: hypothetical protein [Rubrobacter]